MDGTTVTHFTTKATKSTKVENGMKWQEMAGFWDFFTTD